MFSRYTGDVEPNEAAERAAERWFWPYVSSLSQDAVVGAGCCRACWHGYRKAEVVANTPGRNFVTAQFPDTTVQSHDFAGVDQLILPAGAPDPVALSRLVRELVPGAECSPNYVLQVTNHPALFPHSLPTPAPPPSTLRDPGDEGAGAGVRVAVVDTGCIDSHPWWNGQVTTANETPPVPSRPETLVSGHGTFIVGILRRLAPAAEIVAVQVPLGAALTEVAVAEALNRAAQQRLSVINVSLGVCPVDGLPPVAMAATIANLERQPGLDFTIVAAAGNDGTDHVVYPAAFPGVVSVGAVDAQARPASYSNFGPWVRAAANGEWVSSYFGNRRRPADIDGLGSFNGYAEWKGSSFAAPVVTARIAREIANGQKPRAAAADLITRGTPVAGLGVLVS
jgi:hypothetical protein